MDEITFFENWEMIIAIFKLFEADSYKIIEERAKVDRP